jgi:hypothetical protein
MVRRSVFSAFFVLLASTGGCGPEEGITKEFNGEAGADTTIDDDSTVSDSGEPDSSGGDSTATSDSSDVDSASADSGAASETAVDSGTPIDDATGDAADGGVSCAPTPAPVVTKTGVAGKVLLKGTVVTPDTFFVGEVLVEGDSITCAAASCAASPGAATATVIDTNGIIFPGLIDTHNHILFDIFDETDWSPIKPYGNHNQWPSEAKYSAMVDAKQYLNGEGSTADFGCEMDKYGELKALVAGTTSVAGAANPANRACYGSLARTIDQSPNDLGSDKVQVATLFPTKSSGDGVCANFADGDTAAYLIHIAEGVDATALGEFAKLGSLTTTPNCLYDAKTTIVHGTALGDAELTTMATHGMKLTWSPRSNVFLYGGGTDLTKTTNVPLALMKGINVAIAPDWSMGGSQNMLDELRFADKVDNTAWGDKLTPKMLVQMATINAAKNLALDTVIGSIAAGKKADLFVIGGDATKPYDALLASTPRDVRLVMVGGVALYGDSVLKSVGPAAPGCETIDVCCASKFVCVAESGGTTTNKFGQTYAEITAALGKALTDYDAMAITTNKFAPLTPLVRCP